MAQWYNFQINSKRNIREFIQHFTRPFKREKTKCSFQSSISTWTNVTAGITQGFILGSLLFWICINDLSEGLSTNANKLFPDDTSLFSVVHDNHNSTNDIHKDLEMIYNWASQWKWVLTQTLLNKLKKSSLVAKQKKLFHPPFVFNNANVFFLFFYFLFFKGIRN